MTRGKEDDAEQKAYPKDEENQNKFTEVCIHDFFRHATKFHSFFHSCLKAWPHHAKGINGNDYL